MSETKIPTAGELDAWVETLRHGVRLPPTPEEWDRILEGYRRLLKVAEAARPCFARDADDCYAILFEQCDDSIPKLEALEEALNALEAPIETEGK